MLSQGQQLVGGRPKAATEVREGAQEGEGGERPIFEGVECPI